MSEPEVEELLFHWRSVIGQAPTGFPRDFALSIQKARKRPGWQPSPKQYRLMRKMVSELWTHADTLPAGGLPLFGAQPIDDVELIERSAA